MNGKPDINGILRAKNESFLNSAEIFIICLVFGFSLHNLIEKEFEDNFHAILTYAIIINILITSSIRPYNYFSQFIKQQSEIRKNMFTLYFV